MKAPLAMNVLKLVIAVVFLCAAQSAAAADSFQGALARGAAAHPAQYSFADLYRLTVAAPAPAFSIPQAPEAPMRTAVNQPAAQFWIADAPEPRLGLLLLSGLAAAVWVGRRRLGYAY
jgi:hypothetical protein